MARYQCPQCYNYEITIYKPKSFWIWLVPMAIVDVGIILVLLSGRVGNPGGPIVALVAVDILLMIPMVRALLSRRHFPNGAVYHCESCGHQWTEKPEPSPVASPEVPTSVQNTSGFQMTIQDVFSIKGRGTVVTGVVTSGSVSVGETITLLGTTGISHTVVDGIEMFRQTKERAEAGDNVGILLRNVGKDDVGRGDILKGVNR